MRPFPVWRGRTPARARTSVSRCPSGRSSTRSSTTISTAFRSPTCWPRAAGTAAASEPRQSLPESNTQIKGAPLIRAAFLLCLAVRSADAAVGLEGRQRREELDVVAVLGVALGEDGHAAGDRAARLATSVSIACRLPPVEMTSSTIRIFLPLMRSASSRPRKSCCTPSVVMERSSTEMGSGI